MPNWLTTAAGVTIGVAMIAGAIYLAVQPPLQPNHKPWLPAPKGGAITSANYVTPEANGDVNWPIAIAAFLVVVTGMLFFAFMLASFLL